MDQEALAELVEVKDVREWLSKDVEMQRDRKQLEKVCYAPEFPVQLQGAPRPAIRPIEGE